MRTTNKAFRKQVQDFILESIEPNVSVLSIEHTYMQEVGKWQNNHYNGFIHWLQGLGSDMYVTPFFQEQDDIMRAWFENCGVPYRKEKFTSDMFYWLIAREFWSMVEKDKKLVKMGYTNEK